MKLDDIIDDIAERLKRTPLLVMLDVDGTLAPIAPTPEKAAIPPATLAQLRRIAAAPETILAFISGRAAHDTWRMTGVEGAIVAGNHGVELRMPDGQVEVSPFVLRHEKAIAAAADTLASELASVAGAIVENKRWTISVHYRLVADEYVERLRRRATEIARQHGLRVMDGKKIVELRPDVEVNKGTAAVALAERFDVGPANGSVVYVGDDLTDEDAFRALRKAVPLGVTIRVVHGEGPSATAAEWTLGGTDDVRELLAWLAERRNPADAR